MLLLAWVSPWSIGRRGLAITLLGHRLQGHLAREGARSKRGRVAPICLLVRGAWVRGRRGWGHHLLGEEVPYTWNTPQCWKPRRGLGSLIAAPHPSHGPPPSLLGAASTGRCPGPRQQPSNGCTQRHCVHGELLQSALGITGPQAATQSVKAEHVNWACKISQEAWGHGPAGG